jgi:hypothetical protein
MRFLFFLLSDTHPGRTPAQIHPLTPAAASTCPVAHGAAAASACAVRNEGEERYFYLFLFLSRRWMKLGLTFKLCWFNRGVKWMDGRVEGY